MKPGQVGLITNALCYVLTFYKVLGNTCDDGTIEFPYTGNVSITNNGRKCQKWSDQTPHPHDFAEDFYEGPQGEIIDTTSNYCRQPDSDSTPWCYTLDPRVRWGYCDISICTGSPVCGGEITTPTGSIHVMDPDQYLYRDCLWTLVAGEQMRINFVVSHLNIYQDPFCLQTFLEAYESNFIHGRFCGTSTPTVWSASNVLKIRLYITNVPPDYDYTTTVFQASFSHVDGAQSTTIDPLSRDVMYGHLRCPPGVDLSLYLGNVSVTDNGRTCQKWSDQHPHTHFFRNPHHFHHDGGIAETENYCRNMGEPVPFCITTDTTFPFDSCVERICTAQGPACGGVMTQFPGVLTAIDRDLNGYDKKRDCIWTLQAAENRTIVVSIVLMELQLSQNCSKDSLQIKESIVDHGKFCGTTTLTIRSQTNTVTVHYKTDDTGDGQGGFTLVYSQELDSKGSDTTATTEFTTPMTSTPTITTEIIPDEKSTLKTTTTTIMSTVPSLPNTTYEENKRDGSTPNETQPSTANTTGPSNAGGSSQSTATKHTGTTQDADLVVSTRSDSQTTPETVNSGSAILSKSLVLFVTLPIVSTLVVSFIKYIF